ncbi:hypothetical protein ACFRR7_30235 [Streptomyces sp. NPDC056909]|uniref:hypothetical protein n=1 Tax=unclassified Streptomyces TaxID=2593676 RepID=UPI0034283F7C|nr:hypothetical protein OG214_28720 [Streptomyces sp. NBC_00872]
MAKNKNRDHRDRSSKQPHRTEPQRGNEETGSSSMEDRSGEKLSNISPTDVAHKGRQKRFGHN